MGHLGFIAQAGTTATERLTQGMVQFALVVAAVLVLIVVVVVVRKKLLGERSGIDLHGEFTIEDLRRLLAEGKITQAEFDRAKQSVIRRGREIIEQQESGGDGS